MRDCVVVGLARDGNAEPCAVLLLRDSADHGQRTLPRDRPARERSGSRRFSRCGAGSSGRDKDFPRTPTQKPMLSRIREAAEAELSRLRDRLRRRARRQGPLARTSWRAFRTGARCRTSAGRCN